MSMGRACWATQPPERVAVLFRPGSSFSPTFRKTSRGIKDEAGVASLPSLVSAPLHEARLDNVPHTLPIHIDAWIHFIAPSFNISLKLFFHSFQRTRAQADWFSSAPGVPIMSIAGGKGERPHTKVVATR